MIFTQTKKAYGIRSQTEILQRCFELSTCGNFEHHKMSVAYVQNKKTVIEKHVFSNRKGFFRICVECPEKLLIPKHEVTMSDPN